MSIGERHLFTWLHVSDLHFGHGDKTYGWNQKTLFKLLKKDVKKALEQWPELPRPQAIIVTGDIAFSGASRSAREYTDAAEFFVELSKTLGLEKSAVYCVPGNHDVQRGVAKDLVDRVRSEPRALDDILADRNERSALFARQANYQAFADAFAKRELAGWVEDIQVSNFGTIRLVGLNTALLCNDDQDKGTLVLSGEQRDLLSDGDEKVCLLLTHHPIDEGWLNDEPALAQLIKNQTKVHLCGHVHDPRVNLAAEAGNQEHVQIVAAAAHRDPKEAASGKDSHGYNFSSLVLDAQGNLQVRTWPRRWFPNWQAFRVDHLGVPDRSFHDDKSLGVKHKGSGLVLDNASVMRISGVHWWGKPVIRWDELLHNRSKLEIFGIAVNDMFGGANREHVKDLLLRGGSLHVVLADPRSKTAMARYDEDFDRPLGDRSTKILNALKALKALRAELKGSPQEDPVHARLAFSITRHHFKYSAYRIDGDVLFVPYRITPGTDATHTAALVFEKQSSVVNDFIGKDLDALRDTATPLTDELLASILGAS